MDTINNTNLFLLDCGQAKCSWKKTQAVLFDVCRRVDRFLFTRGDVDRLAELLNTINAEQKNPVRISGPQWDFYDKYGQRPGLCFGDNCYVTFTPVAGYYNSTEIRPVDLEAWHNHFDEKRGGAR